MLKKLRSLVLAAPLLATAAASTGKAEPAAASPDVACEDAAAIPVERARETADRFFQRGKRLRERGHVADGCACLDASNRLAPGRGGTLLTVGLCHEQEGRLTAAFRELRRAVTKARQDSRADREAMAAEHLAAIEARLSWLAISPPPNVNEEAVTVTVDGTLVDAEEWAALPVEAGTHALLVKAPGFLERELSVTSGPPGARLVVPIAALEPRPSAAHRANAVPPLAPRSAVLVAMRTRGSAQSVTQTSRGGGAVLRTAALLTGVAGVALSLGVGAWALERKGVVHSHCDAEKRCSGPGVSAASTGRVLTIVSTAALVVGGVGFGVWALLPGDPLGDGKSSQAGLSAHGVF